MKNKLAFLVAMLFTASTALTSMAKAMFDVSLVGRIGGDELPAFAFVFPILFLLISVGNGIYVATAASFVGDDRIVGGKVLRGPFLHSVLVSLALGAMVGGLMFFLLPALLTAMGARGHLLRLAGYFAIWLWTVPMMFVSANTFAIIRNLGFFKTASFITLFATVVGAVLSFVLIPEREGHKVWGVVGSAYSTLATSSLSTSLSLLFVFFYSRRGGVAAFWNAFRDMAHRILGIGLPVLLSNVLLFLFLSLITRVFSSFGQDSVAAYGINGRIEQVLLYFQTALTTVATPTLSRLWADGDRRGLIDYTHEVAKLMMWVAGILALAAFFARHWIAGLPAPTPETYAICIFFLTIVPFTTGLQGVFVLTTTLLNLMKRPGRSLLWSAIFYGVVNAPILLVSQFTNVRLSIVGLAVGTVIGGTASWYWIGREIGGDESLAPMAPRPVTSAEG
ncbi:MATE family efflux transporter [Dyella jiangningensis]|uniref:MATE family efflux transporter n=1 Tax=Dyella jiangningensis TaxID=1379159 RepID=UPI00240EDE92|nr:MATE family efflux transporter [Dyella jiangningensis]MDG2539208.1 MATE family efflux transporter [Dyella jiangningensis]